MSPKKPTKPIDLYVRVSAVKGRSGDSFQSPIQQEQRCRAQLAADGLEVGKVFTDLDQSGGKISRPGFDKARERARSGKSGGLIVHDLTRFGRYETMALDIIDLEAHGAVFISCAEKIDTTTSSGRFFLRVMEALAVMYREQVGERFKVSQRRAVEERGIHVSRFVPPGYVRTENGKLAPHPRHGQTMRRAFEMAAQGCRPGEIAAYLNERELPSGENEHPYWRSSRIKRLLANPVYRGQARASAEIVNDQAHEPLTDDSTWLRAQRQSAGQSPSSSTALLSGLVRCASCRHSMRHQKESKRAPRTYRCTRSTGMDCPSRSVITASKLDGIVLDAYAEHIFSKQHEPPEADDSAALAALADAKRAVDEVEALKDELRPAAYAQALDLALADVEAAEAVLRTHESKEPLSDQDVRGLLASPVELDEMKEASIALLRNAIAREVQTVWVRPPARRSKSVDVAERVRVIFRDDGEDVELPTRGKSVVFAPYTW